MTISKRTSPGWITVENKDTHNCDVCKQELWEAPHGGIYCDTQACGNIKQASL